MSMIDNATDAVKNAYLKMKSEQGKKFELKVIGGNYYRYVAKGAYSVNAGSNFPIYGG